MITCGESECDAKFTRENGYRFEGRWFCKSHFEQHCIDNVENSNV